jgi:GAF domain-containing protein
MSVAEARAALAVAQATAVPVVGHAGLIGLVTVEALGAPGVAPDAPVCDVMDWHLVQVPVDADEEAVVERFSAAAWRWLTTRRLEAEPPGGGSW